MSQKRFLEASLVRQADGELKKSKTSRFYQDIIGVPNPTCYQKHNLKSPLPTSILVKKCLLCCSLQAFFSIQHDLWDSELLLLSLNNLV